MSADVSIAELWGSAQNMKMIKNRRQILIPKVL